MLAPFSHSSGSAGSWRLSTPTGGAESSVGSRRSGRCALLGRGHLRLVARTVTLRLLGGYRSTSSSGAARGGAAQHPGAARRVGREKVAREHGVEKARMAAAARASRSGKKRLRSRPAPTPPPPGPAPAPASARSARAAAAASPRHHRPRLLLAARGPGAGGQSAVIGGTPRTPTAAPTTRLGKFRRAPGTGDLRPSEHPPERQLRAPLLSLLRRRPAAPGLPRDPQNCVNAWACGKAHEIPRVWENRVDGRCANPVGN